MLFVIKNIFRGRDKQVKTLENQTDYEDVYFIQKVFWRMACNCQLFKFGQKQLKERFVWDFHPEGEHLSSVYFKLGDVTCRERDLLKLEPGYWLNDI